MKRLDTLRIKLFLDGADRAQIVGIGNQPFVRGFTTNPSLMRKAGIADYLSFARDVIALTRGRPISFEVFSDDFSTMEREARILSALGPSVFVKIPITNTKGESSAALIRKLSHEEIRLNITAVFTLEQVNEIVEVLAPTTESIVSVFAGRIADTGVDPEPIMAEAARCLASRPRAELLWASPRELLNVFQADACGCHIITATADILAKLPMVGRDLADYSLETVRMFYNDAKAAGYQLVDA